MKRKTTNTTRTINSSCNNAWLDIKFCPRLTRHVQNTRVYPLYVSGGYTSIHGESI